MSVVAIVNVYSVDLIEAFQPIEIVNQWKISLKEKRNPQWKDLYDEIMR